MTRRLAVWTAALCFTGSLQAHHSAAMFDTSTPIRLEGVIADVYFANPHSAIFIDVAGADGRRVRWAVENSGTLAMTRQRGFNDETLRAGDPIEVCGYAPKSTASSRELEAAADSIPRPEWWRDADRAITGRLLILKGGAAEHWSHYGSLDACKTLLESQ